MFCLANFVNNCFIDIIKSLSNEFSRKISRIIMLIMTNLKWYTFLKTCWMSKEEEGSPNLDNGGQRGGKGVKNRSFCWTSFVNGPLCMSRCKPRLPHPRIGVNRGLVGVRIRKHSQEGMKFEAIWNLLFPKVWRLLVEINNENLKLVKEYLPFQWRFSFAKLSNMQLQAFNMFF